MKINKIVLVVGFFALIVIGSSVANDILIPHRARETRFEHTFRYEIARLREIAYDHTARWNRTVEGCEADWRLFARPEILYASVDLASNCHLLVGNSKLVEQSYSYWCLKSLSFSDTRLTRYWYTLSNDSHISAVNYQSTVTDKNGLAVGITLIVDLSKLQE
jgi:hypothetical protein